MKPVKAMRQKVARLVRRSRGRRRRWWLGLEMKLWDFLARALAGVWRRSKSKTATGSRWRCYTVVLEKQPSRRGVRGPHLGRSGGQAVASRQRSLNEQQAVFLKGPYCATIGGPYRAASR
jgi:hypothetical protein